MRGVTCQAQFRNAETHLRAKGELGEFSHTSTTCKRNLLLLHGCTSPTRPMLGISTTQVCRYIPAKLCPRIHARHEKEARPCSAAPPHVFGFQPTSTGTLIQIRFSQRRWETPSLFRLPGPSCHAEDPPATPSFHSTRIEHSKPISRILGRSTPEFPCLCPTHVSAACEGSRQDRMRRCVFVCKPFAPRNDSPRAAAASREGLVALHPTYRCHGIPCVTFC